MFRCCVFVALSSCSARLASHLISLSSPLYLRQRALSAQTKKWKSAIAELKIREMNLKAKNCVSVEDLKQSLVETKRELAKEVKDGPVAAAI